MKLQLKICGMQFPQNIEDISTLQPDYMGFIFYEKSKRNFNLNDINLADNTIKKVGIFVNERISKIIKTIQKYGLNLVQLHGEENESYCLSLINELNHNQLNTKIIKAFSVDGFFDFSQLNSFQMVDYFLMDTKGKLKGGNGIKFNWRILENYTLQKPYFLSGGIGLEDVGKLKEFFQKSYAKNCMAIDVNSQFENEKLEKQYNLLKQFKEQLYESV
jgi:phosphoribosylanthranilate isomerase